MKKVLLLSVVASTIIMAGGDIAPVEPIIVPVVESGWKFDGNMVAYYQTQDSTTPSLSLFGTDASANNFGMQLRAVNDDLFWGVGAGFELSGLASSGLISDIPGGMVVGGGIGGTMQTAGTYNNNIGGALTQAYLTYTISAIDTSLKIGRQTLPKSLSPFAFSEEWQPLKNTFDAALVVNSSIPDTTLVYAFVDKANKSVGNFEIFDYVNGTSASDNGIHMITAQNKSIEGLTLTGSFYYGIEKVSANDDLMIAWGDAKFNYSGFSIALQGGSVITGEPIGTKDTIAYGAKIGAKYNLFDTDFTTCVAYSGVDDGTLGVFNVGGVKTPLYTQMIANQGVIAKDADYVMGKFGVNVLGGDFDVAFGYAIEDRKLGLNNSPFELDVSYKTKVTDSTTLFAAYVMTDADNPAFNGGDAQNMVRVWARYNFN